MFKLTEAFVFFSVVLSSYRSLVKTDGNNEKTETGSSAHDKDIADVTSQEVAQQKFHLIFPGTKWCGTGNIAENYDDLGPARETDMCCREHDHCADLILAGETKYNLTNPAFYTRLACECDEKFRRCLHDANSRVANKIGKIYFNALGTKCYREDYPVTGCNAHGGWFHRKCVDYSYDSMADKLYQWFDVNNY